MKKQIRRSVRSRSFALVVGLVLGLAVGLAIAKPEITADSEMTLEDVVVVADASLDNAAQPSDLVLEDVVVSSAYQPLRLDDLRALIGN
jgi:hypothetical protein